MLWLPELIEGNPMRTVTEIFGGYNHNLKINEGEWYAAENLSSAAYPLFSERAKRGTYYVGTDKITGIIAKDALAWVEGAKLFYNGYPVDGISLSTREEDNPKQLVSMGAYLCVFPDGVYVNTQDLSDSGYMAAEYKSAENAEITYTPCKLDGTAYTDVTISDESPDEPENGQLWLDASDDTHVLKQYSTSTGMWTDIPTVYVKITSAGIGKAFARYDGVTLSGAETADEEMISQIEKLNGDIIIQNVGEDHIIVVGLIDHEVTQLTGRITVKRKVPRMKYVCEANNRLWGCFYGMTGGVMVNQIYACKLGDFKNWNCFMGIASDSYAVSVGTDGDFTGCITYLGYPTFFKENCIHKVYGSQPSAYQIQTTQCRGVQKGSGKSLAILNEILYYKSMTDICAYDGSLPTGISTQLGNVMYKNACAGAGNGRYMVSMQDTDGAWHMFAYDPLRGLWQREDSTHATGFAAWGQEIWYIDDEKNSIIAAIGTEGTPEDSVKWQAESGLIGYEMPDRKYVSRFNFRVKLEKGASMALAIEYDSSGIWQTQGSITGMGTDAFIFPVIPRRCDHFRIRLSGTGSVRIYSMAKILEQGSDA